MERARAVRAGSCANMRYAGELCSEQHVPGPRQSSPFTPEHESATRYALWLRRWCSYRDRGTIRFEDSWPDRSFSGRQSSISATKTPATVAVTLGDESKVLEGCYPSTGNSRLRQIRRGIDRLLQLQCIDVVRKRSPNANAALSNCCCIRHWHGRFVFYLEGWSRSIAERPVLDSIHDQRVTIRQSHHFVLCVIRTHVTRRIIRELRACRCRGECQTGHDQKHLR